MPPKKKRDTKQEDGAHESWDEIGALNTKLGGLKLRTVLCKTELANLKADKHESKRIIKRLQDHVSLNKNEAKLATACVNTQYKLLQRLFMLRVHESKEAIARLRKENFDLKEECDRLIAAKDKVISEKDEQINKLESHLQSLHFQLERVVLEMVEKLESRLEQDRVEWEKQAYDIHESSVKTMQKMGYGTTFM